jgi:drug/metabolite transporter (DMT)-like permease
VALFSTMLAFLLQIICQKYVVPAQASLIMSLESVFGVICGIIFLHESMTVRTFFGCVLIFTAIYLSERQPNRGILKNASNENTVE